MAEVYYNVEIPVEGERIGKVLLTTENQQYARDIAMRLKRYIPEEVVIRIHTGGYLQGWAPVGGTISMEGTWDD